MLVELKNGETYNGHLISVDHWMNINLREVICTSKEGDQFWQLPECYIRGNTIKYLRIPDEVIDQVKEEPRGRPREGSERGRGGGGYRGSGERGRGRGGESRGGGGGRGRGDGGERGGSRGGRGGAGGERGGRGGGRGGGERGGRGGGRGGAERGAGGGGRGRGGATA